MRSCSELHGSRFEDFIAQARTDRYNLICFLVANDRLQQDYKDDERRILDRVMTDDETIKKIEAVGPTINFIDILL